MGTHAACFLALAAAINAAANLVLIPLYGSLGAALATLLAYIVLALQTYLLNRRIYPVAFEIGLFGAGLGLTVLLYVGGSWLAQGRPFWIFWGISGGFLLLCGIGLSGLDRLWRSAGASGAGGSVRKFLYARLRGSADGCAREQEWRGEENAIADDGSCEEK